MMKIKTIALICSVLISTQLMAVEGMWMPEQLPALSKDLKKKGLKIPVKNISSLDKHPMTAIVSLGGCSASFVSDQGLIVTNHHCAYGSIQHNSTAENNLIDKGFYAEQLSDELPGRPGSYVYVTQSIDDVTSATLEAINGLNGIERHEALESFKKQLIAECEDSDQYRCSVRTFYGGAEYFLIKQLQIKDLRLVYAPDDSIGKYGGDVDNWMWPRHTGDYAFLRAYVDKNGKSAEYSTDNVPYQPESWLKLNPEGVESGDFVMVLGYPGRTSRHNLLQEIEQSVEVRYPTLIKHYEDYINIIESLGQSNPEVKVKYANTLAGVNNVMKNYTGMLAGFSQKGVLDNKMQSEKQFAEWAQANNRDAYQAYTNLQQLLDKKNENQRKELLWNMIMRSSLLSAGMRMYRLANEKQKPDSERNSSYQERNWSRIENSLKRIDRSYLESVEKETLLHFTGAYAQLLTEQEIADFQAQHFPEGVTNLNDYIDYLFANTELDDVEKRLAWLDKEPAEFESSDDAIIQLMVSLYPEQMRKEKEEDALYADIQQARLVYIQALQAYAKANGEVMYPDANGTLRVTYGNVMGYSVKDAVDYKPFTTLEGIMQKETGEYPFDTPENLKQAIADKNYSKYASKELGTIPVNFLADLDITGGNSGSAVLDGKAQLVGLAFDGNYESINADWIFKSKVARSINVDVRYMLWIMESVDKTARLLKEMNIN